MDNKINKFNEFNESERLSMADMFIIDTLNDTNLESGLNVNNIMRKAVQYDLYLENMGPKLLKVIYSEIEPLLNDGKYRESIKMVRNFYKPSKRATDSEGISGDVVFMEYDMLIAHIYREEKRNR